MGARYIDTLTAKSRGALIEESVTLLGLAMNDQMGELAYIVSTLALLNEVPVRYVPYRPSGHVLARGRMKPFLTSSVVTIEVPASRRRVREIDRHLQDQGEACKRARHEVRGHYRHVRELPKSNPERWQDVEGRFGAAGAWWWRTRIKHHLRGDASLGWVQQTYRVTAARHGELVD